MKRVYILIFCWIILTPYNIKAADIFPEFRTSLMRLYIPIEEIKGAFQEDLEHEVGFNFSYNIDGQLCTEIGQCHIQTLAEGFSGSTDRSTPWKTLTELLAAYHSANVEAVKSLYTQDSQPVINELLSDPEVKTRFMDAMSVIKGMDILMGFYHKDGFLALVDVDYDDSRESGLTPFYFKKLGSEYFLSAVTLDEPIDTNIEIFLQKGHSVAELLASKHGLSIEKKGTGAGSVKGSGIDCGEDCLEVYTEGTAVWLKANADEYSTFEGWEVNGEPLTGRLVIKEDTILTAIFNKIPPKEYTLTVEKSGTGDGTVTDSETMCELTDCLKFFSFYADEEEAPVVTSGIDCGETCSVSYMEGTTVYLKAIESEGSKFVEWQIDGKPVTESFEVTQDTTITITAVFDEIVPPEEGQSGESGTVQP